MRMGLPWAAAGPAAAIPMDRTKRALAHLVEPIGHPRMAILLRTLGGCFGSRSGATLRQAARACQAASRAPAGLREQPCQALGISFASLAIGAFEAGGAP